MKGQNSQKKTFKLLQGNIVYPNIVTSKRTRKTLQVLPQPSSTELYNPESVIIIEHLQKENEVINDLLERYKK